jgi:sirohydrochlorin cobaltochelatase
LLLVGHGSTASAYPAQVLEAHAAHLRATGLFASVGIGVLSGEPNAARALAALDAPKIHVVPFFMSDGYFSETALPRALGPAAVLPRVRICAPVGSHPGLAGLIAARTLRHADAAKILPATISLLLIGHGSKTSPASERTTRRHASAVAALQFFAAVEVAFLEQAPKFSEAVFQIMAGPLAVLGLFAGEGLHGGEDMPGLIAAARRQRGTTGPPLLDLGVIGNEPGMADLVLAQLSAQDTQGG